MPQQTVWYQPNRVIYQRYNGNLTAEDLSHANVNIRQLLQHGQPPIHLIVDALNVTQIPLNLKTIQESSNLSHDPNLGWMVVAVNNPLFRFFTSALSQIARAHFCIVASREEALATLMRLDGTLADLRLLSHPELPQ